MNPKPKKTDWPPRETVLDKVGLLSLVIPIAILAVMAAAIGCAENTHKSDVAKRLRAWRNKIQSNVDAALLKAIEMLDPADM